MYVQLETVYSFAHANASSDGIPGISFRGADDIKSERRTDDSGQRVVRLYDTLRPSLYRYLINSGISPQDVEEVVQESFLRLYRHIQSGGGDENLRAWVYQVAHNLSCNLHKSRRRLIDAPPEMWEHLSHSTPDSTPGPEELLLEKERYSRIRDGLSKLTQLQRDCLNLRLEGFRYREISEILNVSTSTVAGSLRNAMSRLVKGCV
ncbi:RNA polymerase sigma factor [Silvibacterium acidisoli]|uniref:RNA polymerase sigma factor n=1 Tax=Acidobacteriaceae bacterium ZG23-2 TaxID=2883246 RepID=UPI00406CE816